MGRTNGSTSLTSAKIVAKRRKVGKWDKLSMAITVPFSIRTIKCSPSSYGPPITFTMRRQETNSRRGISE